MLNHEIFHAIYTFIIQNGSSNEFRDTWYHPKEGKPNKFAFLHPQYRKIHFVLDDGVHISFIIFDDSMHIISTTTLNTINVDISTFLFNAYNTLTKAADAKS